ncbi:MAG: hypothetical protein V1820_02640 [archaeon]
MNDERMGRKIEVAFFVLSKKFKGLEKARFISEIEAVLASSLGPDAEKKIQGMDDETLIPILNDAVESARKSYVMTLPRKRGKKANKAQK